VFSIHVASNLISSIGSGIAGSLPPKVIIPWLFAPNGILVLEDILPVIVDSDVASPPASFQLVSQ